MTSVMRPTIAYDMFLERATWRKTKVVRPDGARARLVCYASAEIARASLTVHRRAVHFIRLHTTPQMREAREARARRRTNQYVDDPERA